MPYTVPVAFDTFFDNINLSGDHRATANTRRDDILDTLESKLSVVETFASGSISRFTAVRGYADVDVMVALHHGKHVSGRKPSEVLQLVRDALGEYRTNVRKNGQAVTLYYKTWPNVDIVPVYRTVDDAGNVSHYNVPDMNTESWIPSRPKRHTAQIDARASACGPSFRKVIKMIKWWNHQHSDYLQSYHIEVMALRAFDGWLGDDLPWDVYSYFKSAADLVQTYLWHDVGFADDYLDYRARPEAQKRLERARDVALSAWSATYNKPYHERAIELWRQIFGTRFPAYG